MPIDAELQKRVADFRAEAQDDHEKGFEAHADHKNAMADLLDKLAVGDEGRKLRAWFKAQHRKRMSAPDPMLRWLDGVLQSDAVDAVDLDKLDADIAAAGQQPWLDPFEPIVDPTEEMVSLARWATSAEPLSPWEVLPAKERARRSGAIARTSRRLAGLLERPGKPALPRAVELFDPDCLPEALRGRTLGVHGGERFGSLQPLVDQEFAPLLRRLAAVAELEGLRPVRGGVQEARPSIGQRDARVLARDLAVWFERRYGRPTPRARIADLVRLLTGVDVDEVALAKWVAHK